MATFGTSAKTYGGFAVDRAVFRRLLPDDRWLVYAAGLLSAGDANTATARLVYQKDNGTQIALGMATTTGSTEVKSRIGPVDLFGTAGVPAGEDVPVIRMQFQKDAGVDGTCLAWNIWLRFLPANR
jgi:hypothetical protein